MRTHAPVMAKNTSGDMKFNGEFRKLKFQSDEGMEIFNRVVNRNGPPFE